MLCYTIHHFVELSIRDVRYLLNNFKKGLQIMKLDVVEKDDKLLVKIGGQLLYSEADQFKEEVLPKIGQHSVVIVDCQDLEFIDSAGTGAIVRLWKECRMVGAELELIKVIPEVQKLLHLTRLHQLAKVSGLDDAA